MIGRRDHVEQLISSVLPEFLSNLCPDLQVLAELQLFVLFRYLGIRQRSCPALDGIGQGDPMNLYLVPVVLGDDFVGNAGRAEHSGRDIGEGGPKGVPHLVDVIPLVGAIGDLHVVRVQLKLVELPLEDEQRC